MCVFHPLPMSRVMVSILSQLSACPSLPWSTITCHSANPILSVLRVSHAYSEILRDTTEAIYPVLCRNDITVFEWYICNLVVLICMPFPKRFVSRENVKSLHFY
jgi:hypothetical protein